MARLIWSPRAADDLKAICEYIGRDSEHYARLFAERIMARIEEISAHPWAGAVVPEYHMETLRERLFQNYRIIYRVHKDAVEIVTIVHAARQLPPLQPT